MSASFFNKYHSFQHESIRRNIFSNEPKILLDLFKLAGNKNLIKFFTDMYNVETDKKQYIIFYLAFLTHADEKTVKQALLHTHQINPKTSKQFIKFMPIFAKGKFTDTNIWARILQTSSFHN